MRKARDEQVDPSQPALIVTYGTTTRKYRPLDRDLVVIGRSPCCDIGLVSPEVAPIHCIVVKAGDGWRVRDCTGRGGTHLNGKSIHDEPLCDCDVLQVGTFSFQLNLPRCAPSEHLGPQAPVAAVAAPSYRAAESEDERKILHLKQSRERLARHALNLRRRIRDKYALAPADPMAPARFDAELGAQRSELEQREKQLRFWEKELTEEDRKLRQEYCEMENQRKELQRFAEETLARKQSEHEAKVETLLVSRREELEVEAARRLAERRLELEQVAANLQAREESLAKKQCELEEQLKQVEEINAALDEARVGLRLEHEDVERTRHTARLELEGQVREAEEYVEMLWQQCEVQRRQHEEKHGPIVMPRVSDQSRSLAIRSRELDAYARHLQHTRGTLTRYEQELSDAYQQFHAEYDQAVRETQAIKEQALQDADALRHGSKHNDPLSDTAHGESRSDEEEAAAVLDQLREEHDRRCAELTIQLANERNRVEKAETIVKSLKHEVSELRAELRQREEIVEHLRAELQQRKQNSEPMVVEGGIKLGAPDQLLAAVEKLQNDVAERDNRIRELDRRVEELQILTGFAEKEAYEAELNRYRVALEHDRVAVNEEIEHLEMLRGEVDEARQEMELHISRERLQIAREWVEINRVREQLRRESAQRNQGDSGVRERTAKGKQTKSEAADVTPTATPAAQDLIARLRPSSTTRSVEIKS